MILGEILSERLAVRPAFYPQEFADVDEGIIAFANDVLESALGQEFFQHDAAGVGRLDDAPRGFGESHLVGGHRHSQRIERRHDGVRGPRRDELDHALVRQQVAVADVRRAQRLRDPVQEHDPFALLGREEFQERIQVHRRLVGHIVVHPIEQDEGDSRFERGLGERDLLLDGDGRASGIIGIGDDEARDLPSPRLGKLDAGADRVFGIRPTLRGVARRPQYVCADAVRPPVVRDPRDTRDHHRVARPPVAQRKHGLVRLDERVASARGPQHVDRPPSRRRIQLPILLDDGLPIRVRAEGHIVRRPALDLKLRGALQDRLRDARQRRAAVALRSVEDRRAWIPLRIDLQRLVDQEHARRRDVRHLAQMSADGDEILLVNRENRGGVGNHGLSPLTLALVSSSEIEQEQITKTPRQFGALVGWIKPAPA